MRGELREFADVVEVKRERAGICGVSGSGKTSLLKEIVGHLRHRVRLIIYDPHGELPGRHVETLAGLVKSAAPALSVTNTPVVVPGLATVLMEAGNCVFVVDEAQDVFLRNLPQESPWYTLIRRGRHSRVGILWATQRPTRVNVDLAGNSDALLIGRLTGIADIGYARKWGVRDALPQHDFHCMLPSGKVFRTRSVPM